MANPTLQRWVTTEETKPSNFPRVAQSSIPSEQPKDDNKKSKIPIRERLRQWLEEQVQQGSKKLPTDGALLGSIKNSLSRPQSIESAEMNDIRTADPTFEGSSSPEEGTDYTEALVVGADNQVAGDLVELRQAGSRMPVFAVYMGYFGERNHFYAANGKWITSLGFSSRFAVSNFASAEDLEPLWAKFPEGVSASEFEFMRENEKGPTRQDGAHLIDRMTDFKLTAEAVYQNNLAQLDGARATLASPHTTYLSLFQVADILLPASLKTNGHFSAPALYAVHRALLTNELGFTPLSQSSGVHRQGHLFEVFSQNQAAIVEKIAVMVRHYTTYTSKLTRKRVPETKETALGVFILQARQAVLASREKRQFTRYGILEPLSTRITIPELKWSPLSKDIIAFLEMWASYNIFDSASRFHAYGALILRSLNLYDNMRFDQRTAWMFLQEIGIISPWEVSSRYQTRLPGTSIVRGGGLERKTPKIEESKREDIAAGDRKDVAATAFCIDAPSTVVIDDAISLERTDSGDEFWIHVHAADPASGIKPNSQLSNYMELIPENLYLPGHFQAMLPSELGEDDGKDFKSESLIKQYSLQKDAPALTFSAKVNRSGHILDYKVEASSLRNVVYMDPADVFDFCKETHVATKSATVIEAGTPPEETKLIPKRTMVSSQNLDESNQRDLLTLYELTNAIRDQRLEKGAWPYFSPRPSVSVSFDNIEPSDTQPGEITIPADPYIRASDEPSTVCSVVSNSMVLAGEIAARWCSDRNIPIPYRRDTQLGENKTQALEYANKEIYPLLNQGIDVGMRTRMELSQLTGSIEIASEPGPYFLLGLDMYAKATSPLRRFSDLITHWQIHAALAHERTMQRAINPSMDKVDELLPFSHAELTDTLSLLQLRERLGRMAARNGVKGWILLALLRRWQFDKSKGAEPLRMQFRVDTRRRGGVVGRLDLFDLEAAMDTDGLAGVALAKDIEVSDRFEVELADIDVHGGHIFVKALRRVPKKE